MNFFGGLGASTREALGWESDGELGDGAWSPPFSSCTFVHALRSAGLAAEIKHTVCSGSPVEAALAVGAGDDWGVLAGAALEWSCSHEHGKYVHTGAVELPFSEAEGASAAVAAAEGTTSYAIRYEHPDGLRAAHFGVDTAGVAVDWASPCGLPYAAGWRHGPLAAGLKGMVEMTDRRATTALMPAVRIAFDDSTVSAHLFAEGQPYTAVGGCCQWRPSFAPSLKLSCGLTYAVEVEGSTNGREYNLAMDEGVVSVHYQIDQSLSTQLRVRRCFGVEVLAQKSAVQYSVQKKLADGFSLGLVWQSPLSSVARYHTHSVGFSVAGGQS